MVQICPREMSWNLMDIVSYLIGNIGMKHYFTLLEHLEASFPNLENSIINYHFMLSIHYTIIYMTDSI